MRSARALDEMCKLLRELAAAGAPVTAVVVELGPLRPGRLEALRDALDALAACDVRIEVRGIGVPVGNAAIQSEHVHRLLTTCFAHPAVEAVAFGALWDSPSLRSKVGLLREDFSPKPAFRLVHSLICRKWRTQSTLRTKADGRVSFRGFCGDYDIAVARGKRKAEAELTLTRGRPESLRIVLRD